MELPGSRFRRRQMGTKRWIPAEVADVLYRMLID